MKQSKRIMNNGINKNGKKNEHKEINYWKMKNEINEQQNGEMENGRRKMKNIKINEQNEKWK